VIRATQKHAFTLVELLAVIAMIAIIAALLMPALANGKNEARMTQCTGNLRQWGQAYRMYADDNQDFLPRRGQGVQVLAEIDRPSDWFNALPYYFASQSFQDLVDASKQPTTHTKSLFICPAAIDPGGTYFLPYGMNMNLCPWNLPVPTKFGSVVQPGHVVAMADAPGPYASTFPSAQAYSPMARHTGRVNLLFLGGQVAAYPGKYVGCGVGDPHNADVSWLTGTQSDSQATVY
jgi:prepilin-type N-terminal cleavage/methylation domain-containing protein/prepilin-type processing-associated H-X9-DG protein